MKNKLKEMVKTQSTLSTHALTQTLLSNSFNNDVNEVEKKNSESPSLSKDPKVVNLLLHRMKRRSKAEFTER